MSVLIIFSATIFFSSIYHETKTDNNIVQQNLNFENCSKKYFSLMYLQYLCDEICESNAYELNKRHLKETISRKYYIFKNY